MTVMMATAMTEMNIFDIAYSKTHTHTAITILNMIFIIDIYYILHIYISEGICVHYTYVNGICAS